MLSSRMPNAVFWPVSPSFWPPTQVRDENDESPVFSQTLYQARVEESAAGSGARDVYVTTVTATDNDVGENARLSYRVLDDPRSEFKVTDNGTVLAVRGERMEFSLCWSRPLISLIFFFF